jgi:hypothetical protein
VRSGRVRGRPGVLINGRRPGELPGRGVRCLAVERGESRQEKHDKERRQGCASLLGYSVEEVTIKSINHGYHSHNFFQGREYYQKGILPIFTILKNRKPLQKLIL